MFDFSFAWCEHRSIVLNSKKYSIVCVCVVKNGKPKLNSLDLLYKSFLSLFVKQICEGIILMRSHNIILENRDIEENGDKENAKCKPKKREERN